MQIRKIKEDDRERVAQLISEFYAGDAVDHAISPEIAYRNIEYALLNEPNFACFVFCEEDTIYGFSFVTRYFETEVGGICTGILDLYIVPEKRGEGWGTQFFSYILKAYDNSARFRLEAKASNERAVALYKKLGFKELDYVQLVKES